MRRNVVLDPNHRPLANIFLEEDLMRLQKTAELIWARDEPLPEEEIEAVSGEVNAIITGKRRHRRLSGRTASKASSDPPSETRRFDISPGWR